MNIGLPTIEIYSSIECPYAYLATYRLKQLWKDYAGRIRIAWRALSLEYINHSSYPKPLHAAEYSLFQQIEPQLPWQPWSRQDWEWPGTFWPAFEALACAQAQGDIAAFQMSWALRQAYFDRSVNLSLRHEIFALAEQLGAQGQLDRLQFEHDWDSGRYKTQVIEESRRGWHQLKLKGSATFVLPGGRRWTNPAVGEIDFDEKLYQLRSYTPYSGDPFDVYRLLLESALHFEP